MDKKNSFILYNDYQRVFNELSDAQAGKLIKGIFEYVDSNKSPDGLNGKAMMAFMFISPQIDRDIEKYQTIVEIRREQGKKGGRPKKEEDEENTDENQTKAKKAKGFSEKQMKAKKPDNDNVNVNETENEKEKENVTVNETVDVNANAARPPAGCARGRVGAGNGREKLSKPSYLGSITGSIPADESANEGFALSPETLAAIEQCRQKLDERSRRSFEALKARGQPG